MSQNVKRIFTFSHKDREVQQDVIPRTEYEKARQDVGLILLSE